MSRAIAVDLCLVWATNRKRLVTSDQLMESRLPNAGQNRDKLAGSSVCLPCRFSDYANISRPIAISHIAEDADDHVIATVLSVESQAKSVGSSILLMSSDSRSIKCISKSISRRLRLSGLSPRRQRWPLSPSLKQLLRTKKDNQLHGCIETEC